CCFLMSCAAPAAISTLSLHDALPISGPRAAAPPVARQGPHGRRQPRGLAGAAAGQGQRRLGGPLRAVVQGSLRRPAAPLPADPRSEEHTSELQSQSNLVCRLLLEKKK